MPAKNAIKIYAEGGYYHIYNRGVNKIPIFADEQDYGVFLSYLKTYLLPKDDQKLMAILDDEKISQRERDETLKQLRLNNFNGKVDLLAYCLMPNHYHLLIRQSEGTDVIFFTKSLMTRYTSYFNKRHIRIGPLFQGRYKAVLVETEAQLLHLTRYIHRNPLETSEDRGQERTVLSNGFKPTKERTVLCQPSSYSVYLGKVEQTWVKPDLILKNFSKFGFDSYQTFVENTDTGLEEETLLTIAKITLDLK